MHLGLAQHIAHRVSPNALGQRLRGKGIAPLNKAFFMPVCRCGGCWHGLGWGRNGRCRRRSRWQGRRCACARRRGAAAQSQCAGQCQRRCLGREGGWRAAAEQGWCGVKVTHAPLSRLAGAPLCQLV